MKLLFSVLTIFFFISTPFTQTISKSDQLIKVFSEYRLPKTVYYNAKLFGSGNINLTGVSGRSHGSTYDFNFKPQFNYLSNSDDNDFHIDFYTNGSYYFSSRENYGYKTETSRYSTNIFLRVKESLYPCKGEFFWQILGSVDLSLSENTNENQTNDYSIYNSNKYQNYNFELGIGWGKIRDVTSVVTALRMRERLETLGKTADFINNEIVELAAVLSRQELFSTRFDRPGKYFWKSMQETLSAMGRDYDMTFFEQDYLQDVLREIKYLRREGFRVGANVFFDYRKSWDKGESSNSTETDYLSIESLYPKLKLYLDYSHQLSLNSQVSVFAYLAGGPQVIENNFAKQDYNVQIGASYLRELRDNFLWKVSNSTRYDLTNRLGEYSSLYNEFNSNISYYIEDNLSLSLSYIWVYREYKGPMSVNDFAQNDHRIDFGITYFLSKGLEI